MTTRIKSALFKFVAVLMGITMLALAAEIVLRFFPVSQGFHSLPVNAANPIARCRPNRTVQWSAFWDFSMRNTIKVNNYGFISDIDYDPHDRKPLLAIIGDSFVEALAVPWPQTGAARLHQRLDGRGRIYAFGKSLAPLSQHLAYAEYAKQIFQPVGLIFIVVGNDFDESLLKNMRAPGFHYFAADSADNLTLRRMDHEIGPTKKLMRSSALFMYLMVNARLPDFYQEWQHRRAQTKFVGNTFAAADGARLTESKRVVDAFLAKLPEIAGLDAAKILFVVDGMRPQLYDDVARDAAATSYFGIMRCYFMQSAVAQGFDVIDMQPIFIQHYQKHGQTFEFARDNHWNSLGHQLFAEAVAESNVFSQINANDE